MRAQPLIIDCDPGQDDAIALLMAIASARGVRVCSASRQLPATCPLVKTEANARRVRDLAGQPQLPVYAGCPRPMVRAPVTAEAVHGPSGIDGADLPEPSRPAEEAHAVDFLVQTLAEASRPVTLATLGPLTNVALAIIKKPSILDNVAEDRGHGRRDRAWKRHSCGRVQHLCGSARGPCSLRCGCAAHNGGAGRHPSGDRDTGDASRRSGCWRRRPRRPYAACSSTTVRAPRLCIATAHRSTIRA